MLYIGVDPGKSGGIAWSHSDAMYAAKMPATEFDIYASINVLKKIEGRRFAVIEKVGGYVAGHPAPGSAMFNFGHNYGNLRMALLAARIPFEAVQPSVWQRALGISKKKPNESQTVWKNRLKSHAQQLFPDLKITLATCDAILIAEYARRTYE